MARERNKLLSIGLAMALTGVAAITAIVDQKPQSVVSATTIAAQPVSIAQLNPTKHASDDNN
jgi:hypothetical protein